MALLTDGADSERRGPLEVGRFVEGQRTHEGLVSATMTVNFRSFHAAFRKANTVRDMPTVRIISLQWFEISIMTVQRETSYTHELWMCSRAPFAQASCVISSSSKTSRIASTKTGFICIAFFWNASRLCIYESLAAVSAAES